MGILNLLSGIDDKIKTGFMIGVLVCVAVAWYFDRNAQYSKGVDETDKKWVYKLETEPVKRDTTIKHDTVTAAPQDMEGVADLHIPPVKFAPPYSPNMYDSTYVAKLEEEIYSLRSSTASVTFHDSLEGTHEISYAYASRTFNERYSMAPSIRDLITVRERQEIPYSTEKNLVAGLSFENHQEAGYGVLAGVKPIIVGLSYFPGSNTFGYRIEAQWDFDLSSL